MDASTSVDEGSCSPAATETKQVDGLGCPGCCLACEKRWAAPIRFVAVVVFEGIVYAATVAVPVQRKQICIPSWLSPIPVWVDNSCHLGCSLSSVLVRARPCHTSFYFIIISAPQFRRRDTQHHRSRKFIFAVAVKLESRAIGERKWCRYHLWHHIITGSLTNIVKRVSSHRYSFTEFFHFRSIPNN